MDLFGGKVYSTKGLQLCVANQQAVLSRYSFNSWGSMIKFIESIPQDFKVEAQSWSQRQDGLKGISPRSSRCIQQSGLHNGLWGSDALEFLAPSLGLPPRPYRTFLLKDRICSLSKRI